MTIGKMATYINTVSNRRQPLQFVDIVEVACIVATVAVGLTWMHQWETPLKTLSIFFHIAVVVAARSLQPFDECGLFFVLMFDMGTLAVQLCVYTEKMLPFDIDVNTHDEHKEYTKIGILVLFTMVTLFRLAGVADFFVRGGAYDTYRVPSKSQQQQQQYYSPQPQQPMYYPTPQSMPQPQAQQVALVPTGYAPQPMAYAYAPKPLMYSQ
jgi:hypothetical protein